MPRPQIYVTPTYVTADVPTGGFETFSRKDIAGGATLTAGSVFFTYVTVPFDILVSKLLASSRGTAGVGATLAKLGLYSVDSSGNLTLLGNSASDTTLFAATNTLYTKSLTAAVQLRGGQRVALAALTVGNSTAPIVNGASTLNSTLNSLAPTICSTLTGQTDLPASVAVGSLVYTGSPLWMAAQP